MIPDFAEMYGIEATTELVRELRAAQPTGIHLQRRNIETPDQVRDLIESLRRQIGPLEFAVRHEGGAETPFVRGVTPFPGLEALEEAANPALARDVGRAMGHELAGMGITMNLVSETGPMSVELAVGMRCVGIKVGVGPVIPGATREADEIEAAALAASVAEAAIHVDRDPGRLMPVATGRRVGLLVPRLGDVADRIAVEDGLRMTAARLRPNVGASVAVMEVALQPDEKSIALAADWLASQEVGVFFCFDAHRFDGQRRLLETVGSRCARLIVATIGNSRDEEMVADHAAVIRTCGFQECQLRAALRTIFEQKQK